MDNDAQQNIITEPAGTTEPQGQATNAGATDANQSAATPFKTFQTEEDFANFVKSESMKKVGELYKEFGVQNKEELRAQIAYKSQFEDISSKYTALQEQYNAAQESITALGKEKSDLSLSLTLHELNVTTDEAMREDFVTAVSALATKKEIDFKEAAKQFLERHPDYIASNITSVRIGGERSGQQAPTLTGVEEAFRKLNPWYR